MKRAAPRQIRPDPFEAVKRAGLALPDVEVATRYDGARVLKLGGAFMAGLATHPSAEPASLVVRADLDDRESFLEEAPDIYYLTDYYRRYPLVLVRLALIDSVSLRDVLSMSWHLTAAKGRNRHRPRGAGHTTAG